MAADNGEGVGRFFIVGGPKCGTSALASYFAEHPEICFTRIKEPHFFASDLTPHPIASLFEYERLFRKLQPEHRYRGEASVFHLYSRVALPRIMEFDRSAKIIVMIRNPIDLAVAMHAENRKSGWEEIADFESAWRAQEARRRIPVRRSPHCFYYGEIAKLGGQLERALTIVPRENVFIGVFEEFARDPGVVYREVLQFLELRDYSRIDYPVVNEKHIYRSMLLNRAIVSIRDMVGIRSPVFPLLAKVARGVRRLNWGAGVVQAPQGRFREELTDYFRNDIRLLAQITGRDLSHWK